MGGVPRPEPPEPSRCSVQALVSPCECFACFLPSLQPCTWGRNQCRRARSVQDVCTVVTVRYLLSCPSGSGRRPREQSRGEPQSAGPVRRSGFVPECVCRAHGSRLRTHKSTPNTGGAGREGRSAEVCVGQFWLQSPVFRTLSSPSLLKLWAPHPPCGLLLRVQPARVPPWT